MTKQDLIKYLRLNVSVKDVSLDLTDPITGEVTSSILDKNYLSMTNEDLELYLEVALTRNFADIPSLDYLPRENVYPLLLLAKKELFSALAVKEAPNFDLGADGAYLKKDQRFKHYMELVKLLDDEYAQYMNVDGGVGANTLTSYPVRLSSRYMTNYNYEKGKIPKVVVYADKITEDTVDISWTAATEHFMCYKIYLSKTEIVDLYNIDNHISEDASLLKTIEKVHQTKCRITGLMPNTQYYIAVSAIEKNSLTGYGEVMFTTLEEIEIDAPTDSEDSEKPTGEVTSPDKSEPTEETGGEIVG